MFRGFKKDFDKFPSDKQRDMIRAAVSEIIVSNTGVVQAKYFGAVKQDAILGEAESYAGSGALLGFAEEKRSQNDSSPALGRAANHRTLVCSVSGLVEVSGVEPLTFALRTQRSTN